MTVCIHEARHHDTTVRVDHLCTAGIKMRTDRGYAITRHDLAAKQER